MSERRSLHEYLEKEAERAFQGECEAQKRLIILRLRLNKIDRKNGERRNADIALHETNRQPESQRLELCQANQLNYQAQREKELFFW